MLVNSSKYVLMAFPCVNFRFFYIIGGNVNKVRETIFAIPLEYLYQTHYWVTLLNDLDLLHWYFCQTGNPDQLNYMDVIGQRFYASSALDERPRVRNN